MYPHERSLVKQLADKPFAIIGVNSDSDLDSIREIVRQKNISWRSFWNGPDGTGGAISTKWNVSGWPTIYILDAEGKIRFKNPYGQQIDEALAELLAEMGHDVDLSEHEEDSADEEDANEDGAQNDDAKGP
jgi:hypothetical protein